MFSHTTAVANMDERKEVLFRGVVSLKRNEEQNRDVFLQRRNKETDKFIEEVKLGRLSGLNFSRISCTDFDFFINPIGPLVAEQDTNYRQCVLIQ